MTTESNGQSSNSDVTSDYMLDADGGWQQTAGLGNNSSATWQSSSQEGEYSHAVNGVTLEGTFSQSASQSDNASYTTGGSPGSSGQWVPSGTGSETVATSSSNSYEGSNPVSEGTSGGLDKLRRGLPGRLRQLRLALHRHAIARAKAPAPAPATPPITRCSLSSGPRSGSPLPSPSGRPTPLALRERGRG